MILKTYILDFFLMFANETGTEGLKIFLILGESHGRGFNGAIQSAFEAYHFFEHTEFLLKMPIARHVILSPLIFKVDNITSGKDLCKTLKYTENVRC